MFKDHLIKSYLVYSFAAAIMYCITVFIFIRNATFTSSWILYIGNMFFACCIVVFILLYNKKRKENASIGTMIFAGLITTIIGIIIACLISVILFWLIAGESHEVQQNVLNNAPPQLESGKRNDFLLVLIINAVIGNVSAGSFVSIILSYAAKRNQKGDTSVKKSSDSTLVTQKNA